MTSTTTVVSSPVIVENDFLTIADMQTTGGHVWEAARVLFDFLTTEDRAPLLSGSILELGSGTGWLGMALACHAGPRLQRVVMSEMLQGNAFEWLKHNVERNRASGLLLGAVELAPLDWGWFDGEHEEEATALRGQQWGERRYSIRVSSWPQQMLQGPCSAFGQTL
jgi:hypothetical protein